MPMQTLHIDMKNYCKIPFETCATHLAAKPTFLRAWNLFRGLHRSSDDFLSGAALGSSRECMAILLRGDSAKRAIYRACLCQRERPHPIRSWNLAQKSTTLPAGFVEVRLHCPITVHGAASELIRRSCAEEVTERTWGCFALQGLGMNALGDGHLF